MAQLVGKSFVAYKKDWVYGTTYSYDFRFDYCVRVFSTDLANNETQRILKGHRDFVNAVGTYPINNLHS